MRSRTVAQWRRTSPDVLQDAQELLVGLLPEHLAQHDLVQRAAAPGRRLEGKAAVQERALHAVGPFGDRRQPAGSTFYSQACAARAPVKLAAVSRGHLKGEPHYKNVPCMPLGLYEMGGSLQAVLYGQAMSCQSIGRTAAGASCAV